jgi:hypothetical protein
MARSEVEQGQAELRKQLDGLKLEVNRLNWFLERENMSNPQDKAGIFGAGDVGTSSSAEGATRGQRGPDLPPHAYGMHTSDPFRGEHSRPHQQNHHGEGDCMGYGCHPKLQFPISSSEDPQLWRSRCENYFDMYQLESSLWVRVASMHMEGPATRWLQSVERKLKHASWDEFCGMIHDRFCDRTTSKMRGFVSQDHIGGFSTKRECANTHK